MWTRLVLFAIALLTAAAGTPAPRVRSSHPYIRAIMTEASVRSATFRRLVAGVEATDGIVYVEQGDCRPRAPACLPPVITAAGGARILHVLVDARQRDWQVMADIGHELQHALEILTNPAVRTSSAAFFVATKDQSARDGITETDAAIRAGDAIKKEVTAYSHRGMTKGASQPRSPE
jgi:hypothetical protein